jgi:hypothetical protein
MIRTPSIELIFTAAALVVDQIAVLGHLALMNEPATVMSSIAFGLLIGRYNDERRRLRAKRRITKKDKTV